MLRSPPLGSVRSPRGAPSRPCPARRAGRGGEGGLPGSASGGRPRSSAESRQQVPGRPAPTRPHRARAGQPQHLLRAPQRPAPRQPRSLRSPSARSRDAAAPPARLPRLFLLLLLGSKCGSRARAVRREPRGGGAGAPPGGRRSCGGGWGCVARSPGGRRRGGHRDAGAAPWERGSAADTQTDVTWVCKGFGGGGGGPSRAANRAQEAPPPRGREAPRALPGPPLVLPRPPRQRQSFHGGMRSGAREETRGGGRGARSPSAAAFTRSRLPGHDRNWVAAEPRPFWARRSHGEPPLSPGVRQRKLLGQGPCAGRGPPPPRTRALCAPGPCRRRGRARGRLSSHLPPRKPEIRHKLVLRILPQRFLQGAKIRHRALDGPTTSTPPKSLAPLPSHHRLTLPRQTAPSPARAAFLDRSGHQDCQSHVAVRKAGEPGRFWPRMTLSPG